MTGDKIRSGKSARRRNLAVRVEDQHLLRGRALQSVNNQSTDTDMNIPFGSTTEDTLETPVASR
jgi:hypothetical protein